MMWHRKNETLSIGISVFGLMLMSMMLYAQSQDTINATLTERVASVTQRLDAIEWYLRTANVGVISNLVALILVLWRQPRGRRM